MFETLDIQQILPQSYPFLMIDRIESFEKDKSLTAIKNITGNEWIFEGQSYPDAETPSSDKNLKAFQSGLRPTNVFPETLLIEAAAQAAIAFYRLNTVSQENDRPIYLGQIKAEFFHPVFIGDEILLKVTPGRMLGKSGYAFVDALRTQEKIAEMQIFYSVLDRDLEGKDSLGESS